MDTLKPNADNPMFGFFMPEVGLPAKVLLALGIKISEVNAQEPGSGLRVGLFSFCPLTRLALSQVCEETPRLRRGANLNVCIEGLYPLSFLSAISKSENSTPNSVKAPL